MLLPNNGYVWDAKGGLIPVENLEINNCIRVLAKDKVTGKPMYTILPIRDIFRSVHSIKMLKTRQRYENIQDINITLTRHYSYFTKQVFFLIKYICLPALKRGTLKRLDNGDYGLTPDKESLDLLNILIMPLNLSYDENKNFLVIPKNALEDLGDLVQVHFQKYIILDKINHIVFPNGLMSDPMFKSIAEKALIEGYKVIPVQEEISYNVLQGGSKVISLPKKVCYNTLIEKGAGRKGLVMDSPNYLVSVDFGEGVISVPVVYTARDGKAFGARWVTN